MDVTALPIENTFTSVSRSHGRADASSAQPAHRSTTMRSPSQTAKEAPTSPSTSKFWMNASRTRSNRAEQLPWTSSISSLRPGV